MHLTRLNAYPPTFATKPKFTGSDREGREDREVSENSADTPEGQIIVLHVDGVERTAVLDKDGYPYFTDTGQPAIIS